MEQAVAFNSRAPALRQVNPSAHSTQSQHALGNASLPVWTARFALNEMALDCLNRDTSTHNANIMQVELHLMQALACAIGPGARRAIMRVCHDLRDVLGRVEDLSLDALGGAYRVAEMRLAVVLLNEFEERGGRVDG